MTIFSWLLSSRGTELGWQGEGDYVHFWVNLNFAQLCILAMLYLVEYKFRFFKLMELKNI